MNFAPLAALLEIEVSIGREGIDDTYVITHAGKSLLYIFRLFREKEIKNVGKLPSPLFHRKQKAGPTSPTINRPIANGISLAGYDKATRRLTNFATGRALFPLPLSADSR